VLQPAIVVVHRIEQKGVRRKWHIYRPGRSAVLKQDRGLAAYLRVAQQAL